MKIQRRRYDSIDYYILVNPEGNPVGVSQSLKAILEGKALEAKNLIEKLHSDKSEILFPVAPSKIICVGLNYHLHARESGKSIPEVPLIFLKPTSALLSPGGTIELPEMSDEVHYEGELAVIVGRKMKNVSVEEAQSGIMGYSIMNDVTARDIQRRETLYTRAKGFDTFAPLGPSIVTDFDPLKSKIKTVLNGVIKQESQLSDMIFSPAEIISFISKVMTLNPYDVISTGTPSGVGPLKKGDTVEVIISEIGILKNTVG
ncbi:MAG: fumarylacetoacetate hydrolase family protein [Deltaproteobacteria bacterium]|nr:fumarylacetoacetate hydrolase family protein [Deltaproteobacteria bacterium]